MAERGNFGQRRVAFAGNFVTAVGRRMQFFDFWTTLSATAALMERTPMVAAAKERRVFFGKSQNGFRS